MCDAVQAQIFRAGAVVVVDENDLGEGRMYNVVRTRRRGEVRNPRRLMKLMKLVTR